MAEAWGKKKPKVKKASGDKGNWGSDLIMGQAPDPIDDAMSEVFSSGSEDDSYDPEEDGLSLRAGSKEEQGWRRMFYKMMTPKGEQRLVKSRATELGFRLFMETKMNAEEEAVFLLGGKANQDKASAMWWKRVYLDVHPFPSFTGKEDPKTGATYKEMGQLSRIGSQPGKNLGLIQHTGVLRGLKPSERTLLYNLLKGRMGMGKGSGEEILEEITKGEVGEAITGIKAHGERAEALKAILEGGASKGGWGAKILALEKLANLPVEEGGFGRKSYMPKAGATYETSGRSSEPLKPEDSKERDKAVLDKRGEEFWEGYRNQLRKEGVKVAPGKPKAEHDLGEFKAPPRTPVPREPPEPPSPPPEEDEPAPEADDDALSVRSKATMKSQREAQPPKPPAPPAPEGQGWNSRLGKFVLKKPEEMDEAELKAELKSLEIPEGEKAPYFERFNELLNRLAMEQQHTYPTLKKPQMVKLSVEGQPDRMVEAGKPYDYHEQTHALTGKPRHDERLTAKQQEAQTAFQASQKPGDSFYITNRKGLLEALTAQLEAGRIEPPVRGRAGQPLKDKPSYKLSEETWQSLVATTGKQETNSLRVKNDKGIGELPRNVYLIEGGRVVQDPARAEETEIGHFSQTQMGADGKPLFIIEPGRLASLPGKPTRLLPQPFTAPAPKPPRSGSVLPVFRAPEAEPPPRAEPRREASPPRRPTALEMAGGGGGGGGEEEDADDAGSVRSSYSLMSAKTDARKVVGVEVAGASKLEGFEVPALSKLNAYLSNKPVVPGKPPFKPIVVAEPATPDALARQNAQVSKRLWELKGSWKPGGKWSQEIIVEKAKWRPFAEDEPWNPGAWRVSGAPREGLMTMIDLATERLEKTPLWDSLRSTIDPETGKRGAYLKKVVEDGETVEEATDAFFTTKTYKQYVKNQLSLLTFHRKFEKADDAGRRALFDEVFAPWRTPAFGSKKLLDTFENMDITRILGLAKRLWDADPFTTFKPKAPASGGGGAGGGKK
jgi:hypothetical protein